MSHGALSGGHGDVTDAGQSDENLESPASNIARTIVIVHLPQNELVYLELQDITAKPVAGEFLILEGARYCVTEVTQSIGEFRGDGTQTRRGGLEKLLEILAVLFENEAMSLLRGMRNIGSGDKAEAVGSIIIARKSFVGDFDHAVFVRVKAAGGKTGISSAFGQLLKMHSLIDTTTAQENVGNHGTSPIAPIIIGDDAASEQ